MILARNGQFQGNILRFRRTHSIIGFIFSTQRPPSELCYHSRRTQAEPQVSQPKPRKKEKKNPPLSIKKGRKSQISHLRILNLLRRLNTHVRRTQDRDRDFAVIGADGDSEAVSKDAWGEINRCHCYGVGHCGETF